MVDLNDAGARLATFRSGPIPPVDAIRARAARTTRRHRRRTVGVAAIAVAAVVAGGVSTAILAGRGGHPQRVTVGPTSPTPAPAGPRRVPAARLAPAVRGARPVDIGLLRLWLPPRWKLEPAGGYLEAGCVPAPAESVVLTSPAHPACKVAASGPSVIVSPLGHFVPAPGLIRKTINGVTVWTIAPWSLNAGNEGLYDIPSLNVRLVTLGGAAAVVDSLGPSALRVVLTAHYPVAVPSDWKRVTDDAFAADVPRSWPTQRALIARIPGGGISVTGLPGDCGTDIWKKPLTFIGDPGLDCGGTRPIGSYQAVYGYPADGLWLQGTVGADNVEFGLHPPHVTVPAGTIKFPPIADRGGDTDVLDVNLTAGNKTIETIVGIGANPLIAEEIISSLRRT